MFDAADRRYMKRALLLAEQGLGVASPNPSVGCLIVRDGAIVGRGWHEYARKDHAEIRALREAAAAVGGATAYVTLEPCSHQGRTPPCADALIRSGIGRVVVARMDSNPVVAGRGIEKLRAAGIRVDVGLMADEAGKIIEPFACHVTTGIPLVMAKVGMSLDGKIGTGLPEGRHISSPEGKEFGQQLRFRCDAMVVGVDTILADDPELTYRGNLPKSRPLTRVILDSGLRTPPGARVFASASEAPVLIFCRPEAAAHPRGRELENAGAEIVAVPCIQDRPDAQSVLKELGKRAVLGVLIEGGSRVHWSFLSAKLLDVFYFVIAPVVLGGSAAVPAVGGEGYGAIADAPQFKIRRVFPAGPDTVLEAYPCYSRSIISPWRA